ncbi:FAD/NAD(P)-binding protein [Patescibacteria group bacterium]|nr:FAD/NAD(P)-binding protein [Patescibacteria group bacterium]
MKNPYLPIAVKVGKIFIESDDRMLKTLDLLFLNREDEENFKFMPGQFCEISVWGKGEAPFGIASSPTEKGFLKFTVNRAGMVTTALHYLKEGDELGIRGPLGNHYPVNIFKGKNVIIIGGGFAFTTLRALIKYLLAYRKDFRDITIIYGARTPGMLLYEEELKEWEARGDLKVYITVDIADEKWQGLVGLVPTIVEKRAPGPKDAYAIMCGPPIMIKFTLPKLIALGFPSKRIYTSLEMRMKCGIGKCGRCNIGKFYVCKDGPVFNYAQLEKLPKEY